MMLNSASIGMLGQEHYVQCCSPLVDVPTWFPCQSEGSQRTEEEQVSLAEDFLNQRSFNCLHRRPAPELIGIRMRRGQEPSSPDPLTNREGQPPPPSGDGSSAPPDASSTFIGSNLFAGSMMELDTSMVVST